MGTIKTTNIEPIANNGTVTLGSSGDTFTLGSGVVQSNLNYPAFMASLSADTSVPNSAKTKVPLNTEWIDTDSAYDNSTNYRFTVPSGKGGNYYVHASARNGSSSDFDSFYIYIDKNGSDYLFNGIRNEFRETTEINNIIPLAAGDYIEMYVYNGASGSINISGSSDKPFATHFSAFRIGS